TVLIEPFVLGRSHRLADFGLALVALVGVALVLPRFSLDSTSVHGALWGLFAALLYAIRNVCHHRYLGRYPGSRMMAYQLVVVAVCLLPFARVPAVGAGYNWALLVILGIVF